MGGIIPYHMAGRSSRNGMSAPVFDLDFSEMTSKDDELEPAAKRFASLDEAELDVLIEVRHPKETKRAIEKWVRVLSAYRCQKKTPG